MLPAGLLKNCLDGLIRLARRPWKRPEPSAFRPRLELLEPRAAPGGLSMAEVPAPAPASPPALIRVSESLVIEREPRRLPVLAGRAFEDRLFGEESAEAVRGGKDLDELFAGPLSFPPLRSLDGDELDLYSGKDDTSLIFAKQAEEVVAADALFMDAGW